MIFIRKHSRTSPLMYSPAGSRAIGDKISGWHVDVKCANRVGPSKNYSNLENFVILLHELATCSLFCKVNNKHK